MSSSPDPFTTGPVEDVVHPLRAVADRVGQQVEQFAEALDKFNVKKRKSKRVDQHQVFDLVKEYRNIALGTVKSLKRVHGEQLQEQLRASRNVEAKQSAGQTGTRDNNMDSQLLSLPTPADDLRRWQLEAQTWELLEVLLEARHRGHSLEDQKLKNLAGKPHRYSSEREVWTQFLAEDDLAWERHTVLDWLAKCADTDGQNIEDIVENFQSGSERGTGLWAHGWLYTKEAVKAQKRLRAWPQTLDPTFPNISNTHLSSDRTETLVTQLDPDATTRQDRELERQDEYFESAIWLACWEMIRRGKSWESIREWCQERVEGWRAISVRGYSSQLSTSHRDETADLPTNGVASVQSGTLWRRMCYAAAKSSCFSAYESAVYGALSGDIDTVEQVCRHWDDFIYAYYNALLLHQFDTFLQSEQGNYLSPNLAKRFNAPNCSVFHDDPQSIGRVLVHKLKTNRLTEGEAQDPLRTLQGCLIANTFDDFVRQQGVVFSSVAAASGKTKIIPPGNFGLRNDKDTTYIAIDDYDSIRVVTHMIFVFQDLGMDFRQGRHCTEVENIVVAYVDFLKLAGKTGTLPLYASRLSQQRAIICLAREVNDIVVPQERKMLMVLMKQLDIHVTSVLQMQIRQILSDMVKAGEAGTQPAHTFSIFDEPSSGQRLMIRPIRRDFIGHDISENEQGLLRCFEWYLLLEGQWPTTVGTGSILYKHFLRKFPHGMYMRVLTKNVCYPRPQSTCCSQGFLQDLSVYKALHREVWPTARQEN